MSDLKWFQFPDVRVKVTFQFKKMASADYDLWKQEEDNLLRLGEVGELWDGLAKYGYDLFDVAWLNLVIQRGSSAPLVYTRGYLVRTGERSMAVRMRERKVVKRQASQEDLDRLAAASARKGGSLESWELVERDRMGVEWLRCHAADEAYEVDYASRQELEAWRAHEFMLERDAE